MRILLSKQDLNSKQLSWLCVKPILEGVRGSEPAVKAEAYNQLNEHQKALYLFYAFHNHTHSVAEFYWFSSYFIGELKAWPELLKGLMAFELKELEQFCRELEQWAAACFKHSDGTWRCAAVSDLDQDASLLAEVMALYERYVHVAGQSILIMNRYVQNNLGRFCKISEEEGRITMDEKYPIGKFDWTGEIPAVQREIWIEEIAKLPERLRTSLEGLTELELETPYRASGWKIRQVVHHIADSHMNSYIRFKLALTEETPTIRPYYEDRWAELHDSVQADIEISLTLIEQLHKRWVILLKALSESDFKKSFYHPESKENYPLDYNLGNYAWHGNHHVAHIWAGRNRIGKG